MSSLVSENKVLDKGFVRIDGMMFDADKLIADPESSGVIGIFPSDVFESNDLSVVNAARVSFAKRNDRLAENDPMLINYLMKNRHGTPTEHNAFRFHIKAPLFVFREWHRHRIGHSYNEWSARYSTIEPEFYIPALEDVRMRVGKPGHYTYVQAPIELAEKFVDRIKLHNNGGFAEYNDALEAGVAPELARGFLSVFTYSQMYWTCNARSLMHFLSLRNAPTAQLEIQRYAQVVEAIFAQLMPVTHSAFIKAGRFLPEDNAKIKKRDELIKAMEHNLNHTHLCPAHNTRSLMDCLCLHNAPVKVQLKELLLDV